MRIHRDTTVDQLARRGRLALAISLSTVALGVAACGGSTATTTPHFLVLANSVCALADRRIDALPTPGRSLRSYATLAAREIPVVKAEVAQLALLTAPPSERSTYAIALSRTRHQVALIGLLVAAVRSDDRSRVASLALELNAVDVQAKAATIALGLKACTREVAPRR
jgi:hypothetical protein